jgi:hypothetical protein
MEPTTAKVTAAVVSLRLMHQPPHQCLAASEVPCGEFLNAPRGLAAAQLLADIAIAVRGCGGESNRAANAHVFGSFRAIFSGALYDCTISLLSH